MSRNSGLPRTTPPGNGRVSYPAINPLIEEEDPEANGEEAVMETETDVREAEEARRNTEEEPPPQRQLSSEQQISQSGESVWRTHI